MITIWGVESIEAGEMRAEPRRGRYDPADLPPCADDSPEHGHGASL